MDAKTFIAKVTGLEGDITSLRDSLKAAQDKISALETAKATAKASADDSSEYDDLVAAMEKIRGILNECAKLKPEADSEGGDDSESEGDGEEGTGEDKGDSEAKSKKEMVKASADKLIASAQKVADSMKAIKEEKAQAHTKEVILAAAASLNRIGMTEAVKTAVEKDNPLACLKGLALTSAAFKAQLSNSK